MSSPVTTTPGAKMFDVRRLMNSRLARNVISNYAAAAWTSLLSIVTLPIVLHLLGRADWGIAAACVTVQNFVTLLDLGLSQIMPRELAKVAGKPEKEWAIYSCFVRLYGILALGGFLATQLAARPIAAGWLHTTGVTQDHLVLGIRIMAFQFLFQFAGNANYGFWNGLEFQHKANVRQCGFASARQALALFCIWQVSATATVYLLARALVAGAEWLTNTISIHRSARPDFPLRRHSEMRRIVQEGAGLTVGVVVGVLVSQADKLAVSRFVDLGAYGIYVIVANAGVAFMQLQYPLMKAFMPRIVREECYGAAARSTFHLTLAVVGLCLLPCLLAYAFAGGLLRLWLHDAFAAQIGVVPLRLILVAVGLNALYNIFYQRMIARGANRAIFGINLVCLASCVALALGFRQRLGIVLGGVIWAGSCGVQLSLGILWNWKQKAQLAASPA